MRQATQHGCLPSLLGERDKGIEIVYGKEKKYFVCVFLERRPASDPFRARFKTILKDSGLSLFINPN